MIYITAKELSEKWNIGSRRICILCKEGRIAGAVKKGNTWMIPQNAKKPEDGRKTEIKKGINPMYLLFNPTYFDNRSGEPSEDEKTMCTIQEKHIKGDIKEAYSDVNKAILRCEDNRYKWEYYLLKYMIGMDLGIKEIIADTVEVLNSLVENDDSLIYEKKVLDLYLGKQENMNSLEIDEEDYDELVPLLTLIISKININSIIRNQSISNVSSYELLCHEVDKRDCPLISAYLHLFLAIFYNISGEEELFYSHYDNALDILLPRKWYTPLAEYSLTVDLRYIEKIDEEAYQAIERLSEDIICAYMKAGIFDKIEYQHKLKYGINIKVGYKLFQGKSNEIIAKELGISQYKVKKQIEELFSILGVNTKRELREIILNNCFV